MMVCWTKLEYILALLTLWPGARNQTHSWKPCLQDWTNHLLMGQSYILIPNDFNQTVCLLSRRGLREGELIHRCDHWCGRFPEFHTSSVKLFRGEKLYLAIFFISHILTFLYTKDNVTKKLQAFSEHKADEYIQQFFHKISEEDLANIREQWNSTRVTTNRSCRFIF